MSVSCTADHIEHLRHILYNYLIESFHFTDEETNVARSSNLPKVLELTKFGLPFKCI